jgi:3-oxoacyl-[acyl-carrier protein] reductase
MSSEVAAPVHLVLGATGGIGSALSRRLAARGATVIVAARGKERLDALAEEIGGEAAPVDATDADAVEELVAGVIERHGRLDGAACCVGSLLLKPAHRTSVEEWREAISLNLDTAFFLVRSAAGVMQRNGGGSIALVSTVAARIGMAHHEAIAAAKGGVLGLGLAAAASYAGRGVRVNCVAPGLIETSLTERLTAGDTARKVSEQMHPLGRIGQPEEVASALAWLLDPENAFVTGQVIGVDGGMGSVQPRKQG